MRNIYKWKTGLRDWAISEVTTEAFYRLLVTLQMDRKKVSNDREPHNSIAAECWNCKAILSLFAKHYSLWSWIQWKIVQKRKKILHFFTTHLKNKVPWRFLPDTSPSKINAYKEDDAQNLKSTSIYCFRK